MRGAISLIHIWREIGSLLSIKSGSKSCLVVGIAVLFFGVPVLAHDPTPLAGHRSASSNHVLSTTAISAPRRSQFLPQTRNSTLELAHPFASAEKAIRSGPSASGGNPPPATIDEQLGITFTQDFTSLDYNVTVVEQNDSNGYGPAYLLNGLSNNGYWYQVGVSYDWPYLSGGYNPGFAFNYETFNSSGDSVFPAKGGGLSGFTGAVNSGDLLQLSLYYSSGNVIMGAYDWTTGASANESFSAEGSSYFTGLTTSNADQNGFFTGLMTEEYHATTYYGNEQEVVYDDSAFSISSAWMWIDEYNVTNFELVFGKSTSSPVAYTVKTQIQSFDFNGATEASDAFEFFSGSGTSVPLTLSYSAPAGGAYSPPVLSYFAGGQAQSATLTTSPQTYYVDAGTSWSVTNPLSSSKTNERWYTNQTTSGSAASPETIVFDYSAQYLVTIGTSPLGAGVVSPAGTNWYNSGGNVSLSESPNSPYIFSSWNTNSTTILFANKFAPSTYAIINGPGSITANFTTLGVTLNSTSGQVTQGASIGLGVSLVGVSGSTTLSVSGLPGAVVASWSQNPVVSTPSQVSLVLSTNFSSPSGTYPLEIIASANGSPNATTGYTLVIKPAVAMSVEYTVIGGGSGSSPPIFNYTYNGAPDSITLTNASAVIHADENSGWVIQPVLSGSSATEQWNLANGLNTGNSSADTSLDFIYYHQFFVSFNYTLLGGGSGYTPPGVNYTQFGKEITATAGTGSIWADAGSRYSYSNPLSGSSTRERWDSNSSYLSGAISTAGGIAPTYYHQFEMNASFSTNDAIAPSSSPSINATEFGKELTMKLGFAPSIYWLDSNSNYSISEAFFANSSALERWIVNGTQTSGIISGFATLSLQYTHQYYLSLNSTSGSGGGVISPESSWVNAGSLVQISTSPSSGWNFESWNGTGTGSYSGSASNETIKVEGPISESAVFYPGITISTFGEGSVAYSYGSISGSIPPSSTETIFVPVGTVLTLSPSPSSLLFQFEYWLSSNTIGNSTHVAMSVNSPTMIAAHFGYNLFAIAGVLAGLGVCAVGAAIFLNKRRRISSIDRAIR